MLTKTRTVIWESPKMTDFREQFSDSGGEPITHEGRQVHVSFRIPVATGDELKASFLQATAQPVQGLRLTAKNCALVAAAHEGKQFVLWADTVPEHASVRITKAKKGAEVVLMNVWRDERHGSTLQGMNYSGMEVETHADGSFLLRCSDGWGPPQFDDLVVLLTKVHD